MELIDYLLIVLSVCIIYSIVKRDGMMGIVNLLLAWIGIITFSISFAMLIGLSYDLIKEGDTPLDKCGVNKKTVIFTSISNFILFAIIIYFSKFYTNEADLISTTTMTTTTSNFGLPQILSRYVAVRRSRRLSV